jgi:hypothetical protein
VLQPCMTNFNYPHTIINSIFIIPLLHNLPTTVGDITDSEMLPTLKELTTFPPLHSMLVPVILVVAVATAVEFKRRGTGSSGVIP